MDPRPPRRDRDEVRVVIDLTRELTAWLRSTDARTVMKEIVSEAVQTEIRSALEDELIDVERSRDARHVGGCVAQGCRARAGLVSACRQPTALSPNGPACELQGPKAARTTAS